MTTILQRYILSHVVIDEAEHWLWKERPQHQGYARPMFGGSRVYAHRLSWEAFRGAIPDELTIDHLCRNKRCVNPAHLEPVTNKENTKRRDDARRAAKAGA